MSSKRKSPPTKLDGGGINPTASNGIADLSLHHNSSPTQPYHNQFDLTTIKSESESRTSPHTNHNHHIIADSGESLNYLNHQINGDRLKSKRRSDPNQFHISEQTHSLQNLLSTKRRKSENFDNVPSPANHYENPMNFALRHSEIKHEQNGSDNDEYNNNNNEMELKKELMVPSKKTMNDVLKVLTNKMKGSSIKDSRKRPMVEGEEDDGKR